MSDHDEIKVLFYNGSDEGVQEWMASQSWDHRQPFVRHNGATSEWLVTKPVLNEPEVDWFTATLDEYKGDPIRTADDAVAAAKDFLHRNPQKDLRRGGGSLLLRRWLSCHPADSGSVQPNTDGVVRRHARLLSPPPRKSPSAC
jgi:hypothetical protein